VDERLATAPSGSRSLTLRPEPWAGEVGGRLLHGLVEARIGESAFLEGMRRFLDGGVPTTDALEAALSATSHTSLAPLFDAFIEAGHGPRLTGSWSRDEGGVVIELAADPPIGDYEVPVALDVGRTRRTVWVPVHEGSGVLEVALRGQVHAAVVDPSDVLGQRSPLAERAPSSTAP
jgi:hypothetical protein